MSDTPVLKTINIKHDMPDVEQARARLKDEIGRARTSGVRVLKLVHGYGSTGAGGALKEALRSSLRRRKKEGLVALVIYGENWSIFDPRVPEILERFPSLRRDSDLERSNEGVTLVVL